MLVKLKLMMDSYKKDVPLFTYKPPVYYHHGPALPAMHEIVQRYAPNMYSNPGQLASGFPTHIPVNRLLSDSFSDLYLTVRQYP
jgi:hypothetical protein